ncbi:MAG: sensor domain-containing diguanylate cyclase [Kineosporiaceae bacterium]
MVRSARARDPGGALRGVLVLSPVVTALALLAWTGVFSPDRISPGIGLPELTVATVGVGVVVTGALADAAVRARPGGRLSWLALAVAAAAWATSVLGAVLGWAPALSWGLFRGVAVVAAFTGVLTSPGVRRRAGEWWLLLLDGWLVGVSVLLIGWVALGLTGSPLPPGDLHPLIWLPVDLVFASMVAGLAGRLDGRLPVALIVLSALLTVPTDATWALTGNPRFGAVEWLIMLWALGSATFTGRLDVWTARPEPAPDAGNHGAGRAGSGNLRAEHPIRPRITRLSQIALVPGLLAAALPGSDVVTLVAATGLIIGVVIELVLVQRHHLELWQALHLQARRLDQLFRESRDAIVQVDHRGRVEFANDAVAEVLGYRPETLLGRSGLGFLHAEDRSGVVTGLAGISGTDAAGAVISGRFRHGDGTWRHLESTASRRSGPVPGFTLSIRDVSERNRLEAELRRLASTDALTGLFNRRAFLTMLAERVPRGMTSVLFIDLDGFKTVNDTLGHDEGDRVLRRVAEVLRDELRPGDIASRLGGDEFAVLPAVRAPAEARALALRLVDEFAARLPAGAVRVGASIGVASGRRMSAEALLQRADRAMYRAKTDGGGLVRTDGARGRKAAALEMSMPGPVGTPGPDAGPGAARAPGPDRGSGSRDPRKMP